MSVYIIDYKRTPIGGFLGDLSKFDNVRLGTMCTKELLKSIMEKNTNFDLSSIDKCYIGNVLGCGEGQNIARQIAYLSGINCPSTTINRVCSSGMESIIQGCKSILLEECNCVLVGGVESMSNAPFINNNIRNSHKFGNVEIIDTMLNDGLTDAYSKKHMGILTEECIEKLGISRQELDDYAKLSYQRGRQAFETGKFEKEICPIEIFNKRTKQTDIINCDEELFKSEDLSKLETLRSAFKKEGTLTAGNSSTLSDGASMMILCSEKIVKDYLLTPIAEIINFNTSTTNPEEFGCCPVLSTRNMLSQPIKLLNNQKEDTNSIYLQDIELFEVNEAFSFVPVYYSKELDISFDKINIYGGAVSLGHPIGCSGTRIVGTLLSGLINENKTIGCATICNGGGGASSLLIKNIYKSRKSSINTNNVN